MKNKYLFMLFLLSSVFVKSLPAEEVGNINIGIYDYPPFIYSDGSSYSGILIDIFNCIEEKEDLKINYCYNSYSTNMDLFVLGYIDVIPVKYNSVELEYLKNILRTYGQYFLNSENISALRKRQKNSDIENILYPFLFYKNMIFLYDKPEKSLNSKYILLFKKHLGNLSTLEQDLYKNIFLKHNIDKQGSDFLLSHSNLILFYSTVFILILFFLIHIPAFKSVKKIGLEITSEHESSDLYSVIFKKLKKLINPDYLCIGLYENNILEITYYNKSNNYPAGVIRENIEYSDSLFIYSLINRKDVNIKNIQSDLNKYLKNNKPFEKINSIINSAVIIPLISNGELHGMFGVLGIRKNAFSLKKLFIIKSITKYITIAVKNIKLGNKNKELLFRIETDKNKILKAKQELEYLVQHDPLTNLPNRLYLNEFLNQAIKKSNRTGNKLGVIFIDMDNFKEINDTLGHQTGDKVLIIAANRFKNLLRESDIVIRFGGDEFIIILEDINSSEDIKNVTSKIINTCTTPVLTDNADLSLSFSMGISIYPDNGNSSEELIRKADIALYSVKNNGKGGWEFFTENM